MPKSRKVEWWSVSAASLILLALAITVLLAPGPILRAVGLDTPGAQRTIGPDVFPSPTAAPTPAPNLAPPPIQPSGSPPQPEVLQERLNRLDTSTILTPDGEPAEIGYEILDVASGTVLASRNAQALFIPASNTKTLTAVAVLDTFDGQERFRTTVTQEGSALSLVGGGDPLLSAEPVADGTYPAPASLEQLADQTAQALRDQGITSVTLTVDTSYFEGEGWAATWPEGYRSQVTVIEALWVDRGISGGSRSRTPALDAGTLFATQLAARGITVTGAPALGNARGDEIAAVESLPVLELVEHALIYSDNSVTEMLGFQLARATGQPTTFAGATAAIESALRDRDLWSEGAHLDDASGLSRSNRFTPAMLAGVNRALLNDPRLSGILDGLPVAGTTGTLADRFTSGPAQPAVGIAKGKTGTLSLVSSLGGVTLTADGATVVFGIMSNGQASGWGAKVWEDEIVGVTTGCGCS